MMDSVNLDRRVAQGLNVALALVALVAVVGVGILVWRHRKEEEPAPMAKGHGIARTAIARAQKAETEHRFADAEAAYLEAVKAWPEGTKGRLALATLYDDHREDSKALAQFEILVEPDLKAGRYPFGNFTTLVRYGDLLLKARREEDARRIFEAVVDASRVIRTNSPSGIDVSKLSIPQLRAKAYGLVIPKEPDAQRQEAYFRQALQLNPEDWGVYSSYIESFAKSKDPTALLAEFRSAIHGVDGTQAYAWTLSALGRRNEAIRFVNAATPAGGPERKTLLQLAKTLEQISQPETYRGAHPK